MDAADVDVVARFHDIRNMMYHNGSGITVSCDVVEKYISVAQLLFFGLYSQEFIVDEEQIVEHDLGVYLKKYTDFIVFHRNSLRKRGEHEFAYYWKASIFEVIDVSLVKIYSDCQMFHTLITGVAPDRKDFEMIPEYINKINVLHEAIKGFVVNDFRYQQYLQKF